MKSTVLLICFVAAVGLLATAESKSDEQGKDTAPPKPDASDKFIGKEAGQVRDDNGLKMKLVWCPAGKFTMGSPASEIGATGRHRENENQVSVTLTRGFWLGKYEVTQQEYARIIGKNPSGFSTGSDGEQDVSGQNTDRFPVERVNWDDAMEFCRRLTQQERQAERLLSGWEFTLPTEAQWEYSCRAGTTTPFSCGTKLTVKNANCGGEDDGTLHRTARVGSYAENAWGISDMHGNVFEWCRDFYSEKLPGGPDPDVRKESEFRTLRGGAWNYYSAACRSAQRTYPTSEYRGNNAGFRVALVPVR